MIGTVHNPDQCARCGEFAGVCRPGCPKSRPTIRAWGMGKHEGETGQPCRQPENPPYLLGWIRGRFLWKGGSNVQVPDPNL